MQPTMCSRCHKHVAVVFITKLEGGQSKNEGCASSAPRLGIKPIDDMIQKMGITDEDLENLTSEMMSAFGGAEDGGTDAPGTGRTGTRTTDAPPTFLPEPAFRRRRRRGRRAQKRRRPADKNGGRGRSAP